VTQKVEVSSVEILREERKRNIKRCGHVARLQQSTPVILATWEAEIRRIAV
jgi:hypothetical protein